MCVFLRVRIEYKKWQRVLSAIFYIQYGHVEKHTYYLLKNKIL